MGRLYVVKDAVACEKLHRICQFPLCDRQMRGPHEICQTAIRINVVSCAPSTLVALDSLRRHPSRCSSICQRRGHVGLGAFAHDRQAEIRQLRVPVVGNENVHLNTIS
jgi:hypothetical protein